MHKIQVFLVDSKVQIAQEQEMPNEPINSIQMAHTSKCEKNTHENLNETKKQLIKSKPVLQQPALKRVKSNLKQTALQPNNLSEHQQIRNFINTSSHLSRALTHQSTTVRINPLLLKRLSNTPNVQNQLKTQPIKNDSNNNSLPSNFVVDQIQIFDEHRTNQTINLPMSI